MRRPTKKPLKSGATFATCFRLALNSLRGRMQLGDQRVGVAREALQAVQREPRLVEEGGQRPEGGLEVLVAHGGRVEDDAGVPDQALELTLALAEGAETTSPVLRTNCWTAPCWVSSTRSSRLASSANGSRFAIAAREVGAAPGDGDRGLLHPGLERGPGLRVEGPEDLVELHRAAEPAPWAGSRPRPASARSCLPGSARRRSRRAASSGAGSPGCPRGSARSASRSRSSPPRGRVFGPELASSMDFTLPTETLWMRTSDSAASCVASLNGTLTR